VDDADDAGLADAGTSSSQPKAFSLSATTPAVRRTSYCSSGFTGRSRRHSVISSVRLATRLMIGTVPPPKIATFAGAVT
jgi:hypothetical protein